MKKKFLIIFGFLIAATEISKIHSNTTISENNHAHDIIENALKLKLPQTVSTISPEANEFSDQATKSVYAGNYVEAINITLTGLEKYPQDFSLQSDLAALLGDCSEITPSPLKEKMVTKSKEIFDKLLKEVNEELPKDVLFDFKNEYYFRFAQYENQYNLGIQGVNYYWNTDKWLMQGFREYYSQGVGAAYYAKKLIMEGKKKLALEYAQKAIVAWAQYFSYRNNYYNAYVHYALALGILGYENEMMKALHRSASLINKDLNYHEFKEVLDFIEKTKGSLNLLSYEN